jgi:TPR repeat protein
MRMSEKERDRWAAMACERGSHLGWGVSNHFAKKYDAAAERLRPLARDGVTLAQHLLGRQYQDGLGVTADAAEAVSQYTAASQHGYAPAIFDLCVCYEYGVGVEKDEERARALCVTAAERGHLSAMYVTAVCAHNGIGVTRDVFTAYSLFRQAAEGGHVDAMCFAAACLLHGIGVRQDVTQAVAFYRDAAAHGHSDALHILGVCCEHGIGVEQDVKRAGVHDRQANDREGESVLAMCDRDDAGIEKEEGVAEVLGRWLGGSEGEKRK